MKTPKTVRRFLCCSCGRPIEITPSGVKHDFAWAAPCACTVTKTSVEPAVRKAIEALQNLLPEFSK